MTVEGTPVSLFVLRPAFVRWAIDVLLRAKIQNFFPAYLHLQAVATDTGSTSNIPARWAVLGDLLLVPGGPRGKPYFRPMVHRANMSPWLNNNLAGSFAPSSLRDQPKKVVTYEGKLYSLRPGHVELAAEHLLYGAPVPALALAVFLFRDRGFRQPELGILVDLLRHEFGLGEVDGPVFQRLFTMDYPLPLDGFGRDPDDDRWFEPFTYNPDDHGWLAFGGDQTTDRDTLTP